MTERTVTFLNTGRHLRLLLIFPRRSRTRPAPTHEYVSNRTGEFNAR